MMFGSLTTWRYISHSAKSHYDILSVPRNATTEEIKAAYYKKAKDCHPDVSRGTAKEFQILTEAYETLSDATKRRAYDTATRQQSQQGQSQHGHAFYQRHDGPHPYYRETPVEFRQNYLRHVYKTINKEELEKPKFRPFEDHLYPGSEFNRFEYSRTWDSQSGQWIYKKRPTAEAYTKSVKRKNLGLQLAVTVITLGIAFNIGIYKFCLKKLSGETSRKSEDTSITRSQMFVIPRAHEP